MVRFERGLAFLAWALAALVPSPTCAQAPLHAASVPASARYSWLSPGARLRALNDLFPAPAGFARVALPDGSFGAWLRGLPLRGPGPVMAFDGRVIRASHYPGIAAVATLDVGPRNLQQCADSVIRLHAEWLWSSGRRDAIAYHFTSGDLASWTQWSAGERPVVAGSKVTWHRSATPDASRRAFLGYLDVVFTYAGTLSIERHSTAVERARIQPGDFLVQGGSPGHAILVLDVATAADGRRIALIGEGYSPTQDFHVVTAPGGGAWHALDGDGIETPYWPRTFAWANLRRFAGPR